ncbi:MAG: NAD(P)-dependent oxidoreductase, partial [Pseudorhizobium sp.]
VCPKLEAISYLSTVGVYGDQGGEWVDEEGQCHPSPGRSQERVEAEQAWLAAGETSCAPVAVLRLAGIYGPGRNAFVNLEKGTAKRIIKKGQVFNRIRVEDIARAALFLAQGGHGGIFNITDDEPAPPQDVIVEAARLIGVEPPPEQPFETARMTSMARSFYGANKKVSNRKMRKLGFEFQYPEYRMSLRQLISSRLWRG